MYTAVVAWTPGVENVDSQKYVWTVNGTQAGEGVLQAGESTRSSAQDQVTINPQDTVGFSVASVNQWGQSDSATATGQAPVPVPEAPTAVQMTIQ